jgi:hypothetical protein
MISRMFSCYIDSDLLFFHISVRIKSARGLKVITLIKKKYISNCFGVRLFNSRIVIFTTYDKRQNASELLILGVCILKWEY